MNELTKAQEMYFRESKARDEYGQLVPLYHGSKTKGFDTFEYSPDRQTGTDYGEAYYFTTDYSSAKLYAYDQHKDERMIEWNKQKEALRIEHDGKPGLFDALDNLKIEGKTGEQILAEADYHRTGGEIITAYLDVKNPLIVDAGERPFHRVYPELFKTARENGHDGIIVKNVNDTSHGPAKITDVYIAFKNNQIKSVGNLYPTKSPNFRDNSQEYLRENYRKMDPDDQFTIARIIKQKISDRETQVFEKTTRFEREL